MGGNLDFPIARSERASQHQHVQRIRTWVLLALGVWPSRSYGSRRLKIKRWAYLDLNGSSLGSRLNVVPEHEKTTEEIWRENTIGRKRGNTGPAVDIYLKSAHYMTSMRQRFRNGPSTVWKKKCKIQLNFTPLYTERTV